MNDSHRQIWEAWAKRLHRWGLGEFAAALLEATGPLNLVGAQLVYLGQPLLRDVFPAGHLEALAHTLEDDQETRRFTNYLREGPA